MINDFYMHAKYKDSSMICNSDNDFIDVYVCGEGGYWACYDSVLYRIPTDLFDYAMMIGSLNTKEDLDFLMEKVHKEDVKYTDFTDVYVQNDGNWCGTPSLHFQIPQDVFEYLQKGNTVRTIGALTNQDDLYKLIEKSRREIEFGVENVVKEITLKTRPKNSEIKDCGHMCTTSSIKNGCCSCLDQRPIKEFYASYVDGEGWKNNASRDAGYCPICVKLS